MWIWMLISFHFIDEAIVLPFVVFDTACFVNLFYHLDHYCHTHTEEFFVLLLGATVVHTRCATETGNEPANRSNRS